MALLAPDSLRKTALFNAHERWGARMVEFGGWSMPVFYSAILEEHEAVRKAAGLFDISHMGEFFAEGPGAGAWLNAMLTNDLDKLEVGQGQYTLMLNERGGVIDDLIVYRMGAESYFLVVNASKVDEDWAWLSKHLPSSGVAFRNESEAMGGVALQGPRAAEVLQAALGTALPAKNTIVTVSWQGHEIILGGTGYTGEEGCELFFPNEAAEGLWEALLEKGKALGLKPAGLGCRDTLRLEACYPLNGNDLSPERTPLEAGLGIFVSLTKASDFPGKATLAAQKEAGLPTRLVAMKPTGKSAPPRSHYKLFAGDKEVGEVSSGCLSPTLGHGIALGYVETAFAKQGTELEMEVRGQRVPLTVVPKPFYKKS